MESTQHPLETMLPDSKSTKPSHHRTPGNSSDRRPRKPGLIELRDAGDESGVALAGDGKRRTTDQDRTETVARTFHRIQRQATPVLTPHIVLAAELNMGSSLRLEMMSEEYWRLIRDVIQRCLQSIERYGGLFASFSDHAFAAYFLPDGIGSLHPMSAIDCGIEINAGMDDLSREWKIRKAWRHDIALNIGMHWENAHIGTISTPTGDVLASYGAGVHIVRTVSQLAEGGQLWATKALVEQIPPKNLKPLRFGTMRPNARGHADYVPNNFSTILDMFRDRLPNGTNPDAVVGTPITQIFDRTL